MGSRQAVIRRTTSAGYRLPDKGAKQLTSASAVSFSKTTPGARQNPPAGAKDKEKQVWGDVVRQDHVWREFVEAERRGGKRWHEHWSFLKEYDSMGNKKEVEVLPEEVPIFSDQVPNTTNQNIGNRINTELGKTLVQMDYFLTGGNQKKKLGNELLPS
ncbi:ciliary microtubule inner protein 5 [Rhinophrynus dorsalis]